MISAAAMCFAASAAKRIISTAPIAKFGAAMMFAPCKPSSSFRSKPVVPITM